MRLIFFLIFFLLLGCTVKTSQTIIINEKEIQEPKVKVSSKSSAGIVIKN